MLRSFLIYLSRAAWAQRLVSGWKVAWKAASRFVAGTTVEDAMRVVRELNARGMNATLDCLGEHTSAPAEARAAAESIIALVEDIGRCDARANVSIKLTQVGMGLDDDLCAQNLERILAAARAAGNFVRIDIEDTPYTDTTWALYRRMRQKGYENAGLAVQSYLRRSEKDTRELLAEGACFRLIKGAYKEPPDRAFPKKVDVDAQFDRLARIMIDYSLGHGSRTVSADGRFPPVPALGTHDSRRIEFAKAYAEQVGLPRQAIEFQMLYGIRRDLQEQCVREGYPVRIYVPYGTHWYPYFMRRLAERPANIWFFLSNFFRK